jgi:glycosyltransferase involved in cell wall biosynthesis
MNPLNFPKKQPVIGLNGRFLVAQRTGVQRSAYRLFQSILDKGDKYNFVLFTGESEAFAADWQRPNVRVVTSSLSQRTILKNHVWEQVMLPFMAKKYGCDVLHSPANLAPLFFRGKSIINIHDLCFLVQPAWFSFSFRFIYSWLVPRIAKRASVVITNSNYSKNDILELLGLEVGRVRLTYWAVDPQFFQHGKPYAERTCRILFVGSLEPRKNLAGLLKAFNLYRSRHPESKLRLTVVGCENPLFADEHYDLGEFRSDIDFVGYISDAELARLYGDSLALVYPSFYEGFGFPPMEAMAAGTPVITSNNSSLPEVVEKAALLVNPSDVADIAEKIAMALKPETAAALIERGRAQVRRFHWENVGSHVVGIYDELLRDAQ